MTELMPSLRGAEIMRRFASLEIERAPYETVWNEITTFVLPSRGSYTYSPGTTNVERKSKRKLDSAATYAHRSLVSRIIAEFTNPGTRWFEYRAPEPDIDKLYHVRAFLQKKSDEVHQKLRENVFSLAHSEVLADWCAYGTACMMAEDRGKKGYTWTSVSPSEIWIAENNENEVDCIYRKYQLTYKQLCEEFGTENIDIEIHRGCEATPHKKLDILHAVEPNSSYDPQKKSSKNFRYRSTFILVQDQSVLREGSFKRKPYIVFRFWKRTNEAYGGSPAIDALADIRLLNVLTDIHLRAAQLAVAPPQGLAHDSVIAPLKLIPYGINYGAITSDGKRLVDNILQGNLNLRDLESLMQKIEKRIYSSFFVDPLMNREGSIRTAAEVGKRSNEELTGLAPFLNRVDHEYLSVVLDMMLEYVLADSDDPVPKELNGLTASIEYTGPLAKTQRGEELNNNLQFAQIAQAVGGVNPTLLENVDWNAWLRNVADLLGIPMEVIRSPEFMQQMEQAKAQQAQQQQMLQAAQGAASTLTDAAKAGLVSRGDLGLPELPKGV